VSTGCNSLLPAREKPSPPRIERHCAPSVSGESSREQAGSFARPQERQAETAQAQFSGQVIELARVINALPVLEALVVLYQGQRTESIEFLALRQQLTDRVLLALFETSSTVAELICERDRADQSADRMDAIDTSRIKRLTLASVVVGGVAAVVSGALGLAGAASTASDAMEVAGGTFSAVFGGTALFIQSQQEFRHDRNLLMEI
jgi:hypothetical protein